MKKLFIERIWNNGKARVYFLAFTVGFPLLMIGSFLYFQYEQHQEFLWVYSESSQMTTYRYDWNRPDLPPDLEKIIPSYPNGNIVNISVNKAKNENLSGTIYFVTNDDFAQVKEFYANTFTGRENESEKDFEVIQNGQKIRISQEKTNAWGENTIEIRFFKK